MNIGLLGFGVVGRGVYEITTAREDMQVTKVLCLEDISLPFGSFSYEFMDEDVVINLIINEGGEKA